MRCYRTLDEAIVGLWGLEPLDLIVVLVIWLIATLFLNIPLGLLVAAAAAGGLVMLKAGKPRGYVVYLFYKLGLMRLAPAFLRPPYLLMPPSPFGPRELLLSPVADDEDDQTPEARYFRGEKEFLR